MKSIKALPTVATVVILSVAAILYFVYDPGSSMYAPKCMFHHLTGWDCPGCGSQRMLHSLLHADFASAWESNPFLLCFSPWLLTMAIAAALRTRKPRFYAAVNSLPSILITTSALLIWGVARNL